MGSKTPGHPENFETPGIEVTTDSQLWRPAQNIVTLGEAVGLKIPWQGNKVIVDEDISTSPNITSGSKETISPDESLERCKLFDWNSDDAECIAEGVLCSTDPKEMINNIPIGLNACIVKIDLVLRDKAYLWRPTSDLHVMADAMDTQIQWPLTKMKRISKNAEVPLVIRSPGNGSSNSGSAKGKTRSASSWIAKILEKLLHRHDCSLLILQTQSMEDP